MCRLPASFALLSLVSGLHAQVPISASPNGLLGSLDPDSAESFGATVDVEGDLAVVGAPDDGDPANAGAVYVMRHELGAWSVVTKLRGADTVAGDLFGASISLDGPWLAVGAPGALSCQGVNGGAAYIFQQVGTAWIERDRVVSPDSCATASFGESVSVTGDLLVVGEPLNDTSGTDTGAAHAFRRSGAPWLFESSFRAPGPMSGEQFGRSVSAFANRALIGAPHGTGRAFLFERSFAVWPIVPVTLSSSDDDPASEFGRAVALEGELAVVGEPRKLIAPSTSAGAISIFQQQGPAWARVLEIEGTAVNGRFGKSLSFQENVLAIGAPNEGAVYAIAKNGASLSAPTRIDVAALGSADAFGTSVAANDAHLIVGAPQEDSFAPDGGAVQAFSFGSVPIHGGPNPESFCFGDESSPVCGTCPCSNPSTNLFFRGGCANGVGGTGVLYKFGSNVPGSFLFFVTGANPNTAVRLFSGTVQLPAPSPLCPPGTGLSGTAFDGLRCAGGTVIRHGVRSLDSMGTHDNPWFNFVGPDYALGQTRYFQAVYREFPELICGTGQATTNAVALTFTHQ